MINRLQFRFHEQVFDTREEAKAYIFSQIRFAEQDLASEDPKYGFSLLAEPTVLLYKNVTETDPSGEDDPHLMIAIGSRTNTDGVETGHAQYSDNRFCIIDIDKTEQEIADLAEEVEKAIKGLTLIALSSDTLNFYTEKTDDGTYVSGDVKVAETHRFDDVVKKNNLMVTPEGLFIYVNLEYDKDNEQFVFTVSNSDGTLSETTVSFADNYLVSGVYDKRDESIHLTMKNGEEVVVDCEDLIGEWGVEGDACRTPIVLTKDEVDYDHTDEHNHVEPWQDVLRADVRIKDEEKVLQQDGTYKYVKDENSTNILDRTTDGRYLYVDGKASNIIYYMDGEKSTVKAALDKLSKIGLSSDNDNILIEKTDGFFASTKLEYISSDNMLIFKASGQEEKRIQLNSVELFEHVYYDAAREVLVLTYKDSKGETQFVEIPIGEIIRDWEWDVQNEGHDIKLTKTRHISGNDLLSADAKISSARNNILVDDDHKLYVRGEADNIKYGNETVQDALVAINAKDTEQDGKIQAIEDEIGDGFGPRNTVRDEIDAVSADSASSLKDIINVDKSINVDKTNATKPIISVNLSEEVEQGKTNIIKLNADGLYAGVDLSYIEEANKLIFNTTNGTKEIQLESMSSIISITYDPTKEAIVITYLTNGHEIKTVEIPVGDLIEEWRVEDGHPNAVQLEKVRKPSGTSEVDILKAAVVINSAHDDNILVMDDGSLYVSGAQIAQNTQDVTDLKTRMDGAEGDILALETTLDEETSRATSEERRIETKLDAEVARSATEDQAIRAALVAEIENRENADTALAQSISDNVLTFDDTASIDFNIPSEENNIVKADVKLQSGDNIIKIGQGLYASVHLSYNPGTNRIKLVTSNGDDTEIQLVGASLLEDLYYDPVEKELVITYKDATGESHTVSFGVEELFNDWIIQNPSEKSALELTKTPPSAHTQGNPDVLYGRVLITDDHDGDGKPDQGSKNLVEIKNNGLYVDGSAMEEALEIAKCTKNEVKSLEKAVLGHEILQECGSGYTYEPNQLAYYITSATSFNNADYLLDLELHNTNVKVDTVSAKTDCVDGKAEAMYKLLYGEDAVMPQCGDGAEYHPNPTACVLSAATSFNDADMLLNDKICELMGMWESGVTCTNEASWSGEGTTKKLQVDTRLSHGKNATMTDGDLYTENVDGAYIDPTNTEFTDTNALRIVCLTEGPGGSTPSVDARQNGIYLSNVWDCGLYYDANTPSDQDAKNMAQAAGYNTNYSTDDDPSAMNINYMNNVRQ